MVERVVKRGKYTCKYWFDFDVRAWLPDFDDFLDGEGGDFYSYSTFVLVNRVMLSAVDALSPTRELVQIMIIMILAQLGMCRVRRS